MVTTFHRKHLALGTHHRLWLILSAVIAFLLAALWAQPVQ